MAFKTRNSKFRNVFGTERKDTFYDNIRVCKSSRNSTFCAVNPKFIAVVTESVGGGAFLVIPLSRFGRIPADYPLVNGHAAPVLDIDWCPHDDNIIASGSEDCVARIWRIPENGLTEPLAQPLKELKHHQNRVGLVLWHPSAKNVLLTAGSDNLIILWNAATGEKNIVIDSYPKIQSACWNWNGSKLLIASKDRMIRIINARTGKVEAEAIGHEGSHGARAIFLRNGNVFTTGFSKMSERQYSLRTPDKLGDPIVLQKIDDSNGVLFPLYDAETNMVYLCGKGDTSILYYEITTEPPFVHFINKFDGRHPQRAIGKMPKRGIDTNSSRHENEIARFYRINSAGFCQVVKMVVPRKAESFQEDLYPPTPGLKPAISAVDWFKGKDAEPILEAMNGSSSKVMLVEPDTYVMAEPAAEPADSNVKNTDDEKPSVTSYDDSKTVGELKEYIKQLDNRVLALERLVSALSTLLAQNKK